MKYPPKSQKEKHTSWMQEQKHAGFLSDWAHQPHPLNRTAKPVAAHRLFRSRLRSSHLLSLTLSLWAAILWTKAARRWEISMAADLWLSSVERAPLCIIPASCSCSRLRPSWLSRHFAQLRSLSKAFFMGWKWRLRGQATSVHQPLHGGLVRPFNLLSARSLRY